MELVHCITVNMNLPQKSVLNTRRVSSFFSSKQLDDSVAKEELETTQAKSALPRTDAHHSLTPGRGG